MSQEELYQKLEKEIMFEKKVPVNKTPPAPRDECVDAIPNGDSFPKESIWDKIKRIVKRE